MDTAFATLEVGTKSQPVQDALMCFDRRGATIGIFVHAESDEVCNVAATMLPDDVLTEEIQVWHLIRHHLPQHYSETEHVNLRTRDRPHFVHAIASAEDG